MISFTCGFVATSIPVDPLIVTTVPGKATPDVGYVFQRDTLFPWRTVADNIGYGLQLAGVADEERKQRIAACVAQAGLLGFEQAMQSVNAFLPRESD